VDIPVRVTAHPFNVRHGRLMNLSVSGASIKRISISDALSRIEVVIELPLGRAVRPHRRSLRDA